MPVMLERWNDDKMDALDAKADRLELDVRDLRQGLREHRKETKEGFDAVHRLIVQTTLAVLTAFVMGFSALIGLIATQL